MATRKPSKPWQVVLFRPGSSTLVNYRSREAAYEVVITERQKAETGETEVTAIQVLQWLEGRWSLYERINPERVS